MREIHDGAAWSGNSQNSAKLYELPEPVETTVDELLACRGEGPGPDDEPRLSYPFWDEDAPERMVRVRRYHADVVAGRPIGFVGSERQLAGNRFPAPAERY